MFKLKNIFVFLLLISGSTIYSNAMADYNLNCRAGGHMGLIHNERTNTVTVTFSHAAKGTRNRSLKKGECSWVDRPLRGREPHKFCQKNVSDVIVRINARSFNVTSNKAPYISRLKLGGYFSLRVGNDRNRCLMVSRVNQFNIASTISGR